MEPEYFQYLLLMLVSIGKAHPRNLQLVSGLICKTLAREMLNRQDIGPQYGTKVRGWEVVQECFFGGGGGGVGHFEAPASLLIEVRGQQLPTGNSFTYGRCVAVYLLATQHYPVELHIHETLGGGEMEGGGERDGGREGEREMEGGREGERERRKGGCDVVFSPGESRWSHL